MAVSAARTIVIGSGLNPSLNAAVLADPLRWPVMNPAAELDHSIDVSSPLADIQDALVSVIASASLSGAGELSITSIAVAGGVITAVLSGGLPGWNYAIRIVCVTAAGEELAYDIGLLIDPRLAAFPLPLLLNPGFGPPVTWKADVIPTPGLFFNAPANSSLLFFGGQMAGDFVPNPSPPPAPGPSLDFSKPSNFSLYMFRGQIAGPFVPFSETTVVSGPALDFTKAANSSLWFFGG